MEGEATQLHVDKLLEEVVSELGRDTVEPERGDSSSSVLAQLMVQSIMKWLQ